MTLPKPENQTYQLACGLADQGISTIPIRDCTSKAPAVHSWKAYQERIPTETELREWFATQRAIALICDSVQVMDFDINHDDEHIKDWLHLAMHEGILEVIENLPCQRTPSGGRHYFFRCKATPIGNLKLAKSVDHKTLIETRGQGGYVLVSPSEGYEMINGSLLDIPEIEPSDREILLDLARALNRAVKPEQEEAPASPETSGVRPGDLYNADVHNFFELLREHGWESVRNTHYWRRPGKSAGSISATWDKVPGRFYVFSSNAYPLEPEKVYTPFAVYTYLQHGGDFKTAAQTLAGIGYGFEEIARKSLNEVREHIKEEELSGPDPDRWSPDDEPDPSCSVVSWLETVYLQRGNLSVFAGKAKSGKSALVQSLLASMMGIDGDYLGWRKRERYGAVLYFDFEQGKNDHIFQCRRVFKRAGEDPRQHDWLRMYRLRDYPLAERQKRLIRAIERAVKECGSVDIVVLDGGGDLVRDVNDAGECVEKVQEWLALTTEYNCHLCLIIHTNEGSNASDKVRGHLGSEAMRKSEAVFMLEKVDADTTHVWTPKHRRAGVNQKEPFEFAWDDEAGWHVSKGQVLDSRTQNKVDALKKLMDDIYGSNRSMSRNDLKERIEKSRGVTTRTAQNNIKDALRLEVLKEEYVGQMTFLARG